MKYQLASILVALTISFMLDGSRADGGSYGRTVIEDSFRRDSPKNLDACFSAVMNARRRYLPLKSDTDERGKSVSEATEAFLDLKGLVEGKACSAEGETILRNNLKHIGDNLYTYDVRDNKYAEIVRDIIVQRGRKCQDTYASVTEEYYRQHEEEGYTILKTRDDLFLSTFVEKAIKYLTEVGKFQNFRFLPGSLRSTKIPLIALNAIKDSATKLHDKRVDEIEVDGVDRNTLANLFDEYLLERAESLAEAGGAAIKKAALDASVLREGPKYSWMDTHFGKQVQGYLFLEQLIAEREYLLKRIVPLMGRLKNL